MNTKYPKVSQIEFHIADSYELEDAIKRAAALIDEGYRIWKLNWDPSREISLSTAYYSEPFLHITFQKERKI